MTPPPPQAASDAADTTAPRATSPIVLTDIELSRPIHPVIPPRAQGQATGWFLIRFLGEPVDILEPLIPATGMTANDVLALVRGRCGLRLDEVLAAHNLTRQDLEVGGTAGSSPVAAQVTLESDLSTTVVVCTHNRPAGVAAVLESLADQDYDDFAVLVVDNAPNTEATAEVVAAFASRLAIRRVVEPRPGLSRARNRALTELDSEVVAWLDDDEVADPGWVREIARAFSEHRGAAAVSGLVVPAELATQAQRWFEQFGGHSKGRGCVPAVFTADGPQSPLYPLPPFGVGANMAIRTSALRALGGFDEALGAGTATHGCEDTKLFTQLLRSGATTVYWPAALTRHTHRRRTDDLTAQMAGYGRGLTAFYTALILDEPTVVGALVRLVPKALRDMTSPNSTRTAHLTANFPRKLLRAQRRGMLTGPVHYLRERRRQHTLSSLGVRPSDLQRPERGNKQVHRQTQREERGHDR